LQSEDDIANSDEAEAFKEAVNEHHWQEEEACQERGREEASLCTFDRRVS
jgi:hypothetical protein